MHYIALNSISLLRYFFHIAYQGTAYNGWQKQPLKLSVQAVLENTLSKILKTNITVIGCGRTDAGVHASQYYFHIDVAVAIDCERLLFLMNKNLPNDIAVFDILLVENHQHARYSAVQRQYNYYFHCTKNPYLSQYSTELTLKIVHLKEMAAAIQLLNVHSNYIAFCVQPELYENTLCKVNNAQLWYNTESEQYCFQVSSNRFLRKMIRILMHHFIQIGAGKMQLEDFEKLLACMQPQTNVFPFVQQGLFLSKIDYPFLNLANKTAYFISNKQKKNLNWIRL